MHRRSKHGRPVRISRNPGREVPRVLELVLRDVLELRHIDGNGALYALSVTPGDGAETNDLHSPLAHVAAGLTPLIDAGLAPVSGC